MIIFVFKKSLRIWRCRYDFEKQSISINSEWLLMVFLQVMKPAQVARTSTGCYEMNYYGLKQGSDKQTRQTAKFGSIGGNSTFKAGA